MRPDGQHAMWFLFVGIYFDLVINLMRVRYADLVSRDL